MTLLIKSCECQWLLLSHVATSFFLLAINRPRQRGRDSGFRPSRCVNTSKHDCTEGKLRCKPIQLVVSGVELDGAGGVKMLIDFWFESRGKLGRGALGVSQWRNG